MVFGSILLHVLIIPDLKILKEGGYNKQLGVGANSPDLLETIEKRDRLTNCCFSIPAKYHSHPFLSHFKITFPAMGNF